MGSQRISAIVLAGGRASRFGADKLAALLDGRPLLHHAIGAVEGMADEVLVIAAPGQVPDLPPCPVPLRVVHDAVAHEGPLVGLLTGADAVVRHVGAPRDATGRDATPRDAAARDAVPDPALLVIGGDMPSLVPAVLAQLVAAIEEGHDAAVLADDDGSPRPLPLAIRRSAALIHGRAVLDGRRRSLHALLSGLDTAVIRPAAWREADRDGRTLRDVDRPEDLPAVVEAPGTGPTS